MKIATKDFLNTDSNSSVRLLYFSNFASFLKVTLSQKLIVETRRETAIVTIVLTT